MLENGHRINDDGKEQKKCSTCQSWIDLLDSAGNPMFSKRGVSKDGLSYSCKPCERKTAMKSYKGQKSKKKQRQRYEENREKVLERSRKNYQENRDVRLDQSRLYRQNNPDVYRSADARRRERLKNAEKDDVSREEIIKRDSIMLEGKLTPICQICFDPILPNDPKGQLEVDHIVPINAGGDDTARNKRTVHHECNIKRPKDGRDLKKE